MRGLAERQVRGSQKHGANSQLRDSFPNTKRLRIVPFKGLLYGSHFVIIMRCVVVSKMAAIYQLFYHADG
jgi:hypothetical protein